jgi:hypothetical protein
VTLSTKLPPYRVLAEPLLSFGDGHADARHLHPLRGLLEFGPYSKSAFQAFRDQVRIATICPEDTQAAVFRFLGSLQQKHEPKERPDYLPEFPGFEAVFGVQIHGASGTESHITLAKDTGDGGMAQLGAALRTALDRLLLVRDQFDVVAIHLPDRWKAAFEDLDKGLDLHHEIKSIAAVAGIPTQFLNDGALTYRDRCSVAWRLGIAQYVKAGGTPWRLVPASADTAYVGLSYAMRGATNDQFVTCCSQVFDADGGGMEFVAYEVGDGVGPDRDNPFLSRADMRAVMARSLSVYQERNAGKLPRRVVIHKTQAFKDEEIDGVFDAWGAADEVECVQVIASPDWRAVVLQAPKGSAAKNTIENWPVERGTLIPFSDRSILQFLNGDAPSVSLRRHFVQGGKGIPRPVTLVRQAGAGPLELLGEDALALSKMNWNNDALFDSLPVTIEYSTVLSKTIARSTSLPSGVYPYRLFM